MYEIVVGGGGGWCRGVALRFRFSLQIMYDTFDLIAIILHGKCKFSSRGKIKKLKMEIIKAII